MRYPSLFISLSVVCLLLVILIPGTSAAAPVANFNANRTYGAVPLTVSFTDASSDNPTGWAWYFGDETYAKYWVQVNASAGWSARNRHSSVVMPDGSIVLMGGWEGYNVKNDVWRSTDNGTTWTQVNENAGWSARRSHSSVVMPDGSIVLMGGWDSSSRNDIWRSTDNGTTWTQVNTGYRWSARYSHSSVVMPDGSIVLMGGVDSSDSYYNDTWQSTDNFAVWTKLNESAGWSARQGHSSVVMPDGSIVLMGGYGGSFIFYNDVWRSMDNGETWTQVNASAGWSARRSHSSVVMPDGSIVLMGGSDIGGPRNDVWRSTDNGATWTQVDASTEWSTRYMQSAVVMPDGSIVLMGGYQDAGTAYYNDVWRVMTAGSKAQNPSHTYTKPGIYQVALQAYNADGYTSMRKTGYITVTSTKTRIGVVRNNKTWILDASGNGVYGAGDIVYNYGIAGDKYVIGDWNGNGSTRIGVVRFNNLWLLDASGNGAYGAGDLAYTFGKAGDVYVTGDWDGNGKTKIGVVRFNTTWLLDASGDGKWGPGDYQYVYGRAGDVYVTGDWNGDHKTEIGVVRNNKTWILDASGNGLYGEGDIVYNYGIAGDRYVMGDWADTGTTRIGVVRNNKTWILDASGNGAYGAGDLAYTFGKAGDRYITGKWN